jgi:hypothetical protein
LSIGIAGKPPFLSQELFLEILSDLACPFRKFYRGEFLCREFQKIPEAEANVAVHTRSGPQLLQVGGNRQLDGENLDEHSLAPCPIAHSAVGRSRQSAVEPSR